MVNKVEPSKQLAAALQSWLLPMEHLWNSASAVISQDMPIQDCLLSPVWHNGPHSRCLPLQAETSLEWKAYCKMYPVVAHLWRNGNMIGSATVSAHRGTKKAMLTLTAVEGSGPSLIGRNWLSTFPLDWKQIHPMNSALQEVLLSHHVPVSANKLGTLKRLKVSIVIDSAAQPRFCKAHSIPYAMRSLQLGSSHKSYSQCQPEIRENMWRFQVHHEPSSQGRSLSNP